MLKRTLFGLLAAALLLAVPASFQPVQATTYTLRYSDIGPPRGPPMTLSEAMTAAATRRETSPPHAARSGLYPQIKTRTYDLCDR